MILTLQLVLNDSSMTFDQMSAYGHAVAKALGEKGLVEVGDAVIVPELAMKINIAYVAPPMPMFGSPN
jgi:acyl-coenzyme A synthetase/AMP-(fatty) acid ligase